MGLREIKTFEVTCDRGTHPRCQGKDATGQHRAINAYSLKHAHQLMRTNGWKVNDGSRTKSPTYICPACRLSK